MAAARSPLPYSEVVTQRAGKQAAKSARTRATILDAAGQVVRDDGVTNLTLDRVAAAAGISKGGLLYHFGTKQELVLALLAHTLETADDQLNLLADSNDRKPGSFAQAYLDYVSTGQHESGAATGVFAAAALDDGDLAPARAMFAKWQERLVNNDGLDETTALLARVVGDGLWLIDLFGLAPPTTEQRAALLAHIQTQLDQP